MRPRLTFKNPSWSSGALVNELPATRNRNEVEQRRRLAALRDTYGNEVADHIALFAHLVNDQREQWTPQDVKRTLDHIAAKPDVDVDALDDDSRSQLSVVAVRRYRAAVGPSVDLKLLSPVALAACACEASQRFKGRRGRPATDRLAIGLIQGLQRATNKRLWSPWGEALIRDALDACDLGCAPATVKRLRSAASKSRDVSALRFSATGVDFLG